MVLATAIGAAIPVLIVGAVVWVGITNDRQERLDRRLDEAAGFAIPSSAAGSPKSHARPATRTPSSRCALARWSSPTPTSHSPS